MAKDPLAGLLYGNQKQSRTKNTKINGLGIKKKDITIYQTSAGDRTLTQAQKRKVIEEAKYKCSNCGKKFDKAFLDVHHKKEVAKHKNPLGNLPEYSWGKKIKPKYDRKSNLQVLCKKCHNEVHRKRTKLKTAKKKRNPWEFY